MLSDWVSGPRYPSNNMAPKTLLDHFMDRFMKPTCIDGNTRFRTIPDSLDMYKLAYIRTPNGDPYEPLIYSELQ